MSVLAEVKLFPSTVLEKDDRFPQGFTDLQFFARVMWPDSVGL
jgi:hypothetical protein